MAWTEEMINDLKQMWKDGLTTNEIAKRLGVSKNSIVGKVHRLNLKARPSPIKKKEEVTTAETPVVKEEKEEKAKAASKKLKKVSITPVNIAKPKEAKKDQKLYSDVEAQAKVLELGAAFWKKLNEFVITKKIRVSPDQLKAMTYAMRIPTQFPSAYQSIQLLALLEEAEANGFKE